MRTRILAAVAAGAVLAGGAEAAVTYSFESSDGTQAFIWTSPTFVGPADANVFVPNLDSCTATFPSSCYGVRFISDTSPSFGPTDDHDRLYYITGDDPLFINQYLFADGAFAAVGVYDTLRGGDAGQLTVAAAGVPEPATWAVMLLGFGGLGAALRRRRFAAAA